MESTDSNVWNHFKNIPINILPLIEFRHCGCVLYFSVFFFLFVGVHIMLNDLLPANVYYRFNPYLTEMISMVEINPQKLEQLQRDAIMYLRRNEDKFQEAAKVLSEEKTYLQKVKDVINLKRELYGF